LFTLQFCSEKSPLSPPVVKGGKREAQGRFLPVGTSG